MERVAPAFRRQVEALGNLVRSSNRVVVLTGAGVSTESGIPDFRSPGGLWDRHDPKKFTYPKFLASEEVRRLVWALNREIYPVIAKARPNRAHECIIELERMGKLDSVITQNVDSLHQRAGNSDVRVIELHGNINWVRCLSCERRYPRERLQSLFEKGVEVPTCWECGGLLKSDTISFGQPMPQELTRRAQARARCCDLFIVVGSSLAVHPAASLPLRAKRAGASLAIVNLSQTPLDQRADVLVRGRAGEVLDEVLGVVRHFSN